MQKNKVNEVILVICTKNEENTIEIVIENSKKYVDKILVVDGHSIDKTVQKARLLGIEVVLDNGKGKGEAIRLAINKSKDNDILVFMDADGSHEPNDIPKMVDLIKKNKADLVIGSRGKGGSDELSGGFEKNIRLIGSTLITMSINLRYRSRITDSQNGFRVIRADVAKKIKLVENTFTIEQEMLMKVLKNRYRVAEIPSHEYERKYGKSNIKLLSETWLYFKSLIKGIVL